MAHPGFPRPALGVPVRGHARDPQGPDCPGGPAAGELIRFSFYRHEFSAVGAAVSLIAVEAALRDRYGRGRLVDYIQKARDDGLLTAEEADLLDTAGRPIRNRFAHGELTHVTLTMPMAVNIVATSIRLLTVLHGPSQP
ncbi:hypothetical protein [Streptomyces mirabilis]|uniref:hypothetical protein n=1 Tax=Streptomyces mirabilis TaxID=68239 RepID=UPI0036C89480